MIKSILFAIIYSMKNNFFNTTIYLTIENKNGAYFLSNENGSFEISNLDSAPTQEASLDISGSIITINETPHFSVNKAVLETQIDEEEYQNQDITKLLLEPIPIKSTLGIIIQKEL